MLRAILCACAVLSVAWANDASDGDIETNRHAQAPVTVTPLGPIRGSWMETRRGRRFQAYRGIPYGLPPVGALRFKPPQPILKYPNEVNATVDGPACPQPVVDPNFLVDEDCLRLNVYTPTGNRKKQLPVIVYLHPGGFYSITGRSDIAGPQYLLERDIVLVTINYRLGTLGYLSTGDRHAPGNYGFKDQVAALRWIQRNIAAFSGDPRLVTLAGYSAGSLSIGLLMVSPMAKGLFHRAIGMSASPISQVVIGPHQRHLAERQARLIGCPVRTNREMVDCLREKPWKEISDSLDSMFEFGYDPVLLWNVVLEPQVPGEERFIVEQPLTSLQNGRLHAVPFIVGQTSDEFFWKAFSVARNATLLSTMNSEWDRIAPISFMLPTNDTTISSTLRQAYFGADSDIGDADSLAALGRLYSDAVIGFSVHRMANVMCRVSPQPVYHYEFAYIGNRSHYIDPATGRPVGAAHHDDLLYLFEVPASFPNVPLGTEDDVIVQRMTAIWYNFARYGDPNPRPDTPELNFHWPRMTAKNRRYLRIGNNFTIHTNLFEDRYRVWDELYPIQY